jgi:hypothetical protein
MHVATVRPTLRKAWELDDAAEAEHIIRDLANRTQREAPSVGDAPLALLSRTCGARSGGWRAT